MDRLVLQIPWPTPSLNELANRRTRFAYKVQRARWMKRVSDAYLDEKARRGRGPRIWMKPPRCRVRVTIERFGRVANALDADNLVGGLKPVLDALRRLQLLDDDDAGAIELHAAQPTNPHRAPRMWTRITLERVEDDR